jgi:hypothetical protein
MSTLRVGRGFLILVAICSAVAGVGVASPAAQAAIQPISTAVLPYSTDPVTHAPTRGANAVSADGRHVLFEGGYGGSFYSVASGAALPSPEAVTMSADGRWLAAVSLDHFRTLSIATVFGSDRQTLGDVVSSVSLSRDGSKVAFVKNRGGKPNAFIWFRETGAKATIDDGFPWTSSNTGIDTVSLNADGRFVAYLNDDFSSPDCSANGGSSCQFDAWRYDTTTFVRERISADSSGSRLNAQIGGLVLSGNGKVATFFAQNDPTDRVRVYRKNLESGELREIASYPFSSSAGAFPPSISDDGDRVAYSGTASSDPRYGFRDAFVYERSSDSTIRLTTRTKWPTLISGDGTTVIYNELPADSDVPVQMIAHFPGTIAPRVAAVPAKTSITVPLTGIPEGAKAAIVNLTIVGPEAAGYATAWPCDEARPNTSNLNFSAGQTVANAVIMKPSAANTLCIYTDAAADILVDVSGDLSSGNSFVGQSPSRLLDTRDANPAPNLRVGDIATVGTAGSFNADADSVVLNVTATNAAAAGFVTAWPCDQPRPNVSSVNFVPGTAVPNLVIAKTSADHTVCLFTDQPVDLIADLSGWFPAGNSYHGLTPLRLFDSRKPGSGPQLASATAAVNTDPRVPTDAEAVVLNLTGTNPTAAGFGTAYPCSQTQPSTSNLNFVAGQTVPNLVITKPSSNGTTCLFSSAPIDYIVDSNGYFPAGSGYVAITPVRITDTRNA